MSLGMFKVIGKFKDENGYPLTGGDYEVALLDEDPAYKGPQVELIGVALSRGGQVAQGQ